MYRLSKIIPVRMSSRYVSSISGPEKAIWWQWRDRVFFVKRFSI